MLDLRNNVIKDWKNRIPDIAVQNSTENAENLYKYLGFEPKKDPESKLGFRINKSSCQCIPLKNMVKEIDTDTKATDYWECQKELKVELSYIANALNQAVYFAQDASDEKIQANQLLSATFMFFSLLKTLKSKVGSMFVGVTCFGHYENILQNIDTTCKNNNDLVYICNFVKENVKNYEDKAKWGKSLATKIENSYNSKINNKKKENKKDYNEKETRKNYEQEVDKINTLLKTIDTYKQQIQNLPQDSCKEVNKTLQEAKTKITENQYYYNSIKHLMFDPQNGFTAIQKLYNTYKDKVAECGKTINAITKNFILPANCTPEEIRNLFSSGYTILNKLILEYQKNNGVKPKNWISIQKQLAELIRQNNLAANLDFINKFNPICKKEFGMEILPLLQNITTKKTLSISYDDKQQNKNTTEVETLEKIKKDAQKLEKELYINKWAGSTSPEKRKDNIQIENLVKQINSAKTLEDAQKHLAALQKEKEDRYAKEKQKAKELTKAKSQALKLVENKLGMNNNWNGKLENKFLYEKLKNQINDSDNIETIRNIIAMNQKTKNLISQI